MVCGMLRCCFAARCTQHEAADIMIMSCIALQTLLSGLSGAAIGGGFSVSTWAPYLCVLPSSVLSLVWAQFALFIAALPLAAGLAHLSPRVSTYFWKSKPGLANFCNVILRVQVCRLWQCCLYWGIDSQQKHPSLHSLIGTGQRWVCCCMRC